MNRGISGSPSAPAPLRETVRPGRSDVFFAALSGLLATGAFPDVGIAPLAWICLAPLLAAINGRSPGRSFRLGVVAGLAHYLTLLYWVVYTMQVYGHLPLALCLPTLVLLASYLSLYTGLFAAILARLGRSGLRMALLAPPSWVALEYLRATLFTGFPWELLGYAQFRSPALIQIADITGVYGISFLTVAANAGLFLMGCAALGRTWFDETVTLRLAIGAAGTVLALAGASLGYGAWRISTLEDQISRAESIRATVVQANIDQGVKWLPAFQRTTVDRYLSLSAEALGQKPDLVVWPETATPFYFARHHVLATRIRKAVAAGDASFIIGSPSVEGRGDGPAYFNSAYLVDDRGAVTGRYDKVHLVPFGEYVPMQRFLPFLGKMVQAVGDFTAGRRGHTLDWKGRPLGVQICYEMIFPPLSRAMVRNGATLLVNITNDAWFGRTAAPVQHFSMAVLRAVENRRSVIRSANTGISGFVDPAGRIVARTGLLKSATLTRKVPVLFTQSLYTRIGDLFAQACLTLIVGAALAEALARRWRSRPKPE